jgi:hypothetical protein
MNNNNNKNKFSIHCENYFKYQKYSNLNKKDNLNAILCSVYYFMNRLIVSQKRE